MPNNRTELITKTCVVCGNAFSVCPPGKRSRYCRKPFRTSSCSRECYYKTHYRNGRECTTLSDVDAAYIAGFLDGEGSVILYKRRDTVALRVSFSNTKINVLEWIQRVTGVGNIIRSEHPGKPHATSYMLLINSNAGATLLKQVIPYLILKLPQAEIGVDFYAKLRNPQLKADRIWQYEYRSQMQSLNHRGT